MRIGLGPLLGALAVFATIVCVASGTAKPAPLYAAGSLVLTVTAFTVAARRGRRPILGILLTAVALTGLVVLNLATGPRDATVMFALPALAIVVALVASGRAAEARLPDPDVLAMRAVEYRRRAVAPTHPPAVESHDFPGLW